MSLPPAERLRAAGLKVTKGRVAALESLAAQSHATAEELQRRIAAEGVPMTLQAVYLALQVLTDAQVLRRIEPAGSAARYELRVGDNHHHLVCTRCSRVVDVDCATEEAPCLLPADTHGFAVATAEITFWGLCPGCAEEEGAE
ncbi:Fur family transcriptional regulator [Amnibacterium kyonggiense]|uniref:Fur family ferric uptake transcriptional regulator n=1 Tax=Amnibacterium kyonggiense TaxID=595671 RepID=A0A4R7FS62_9MICO|nr:Fur family transcriptional regulator [Amnibacterium kyonggiense]TDS80509.1 Fur family ferric uptake transcriptional regulator [Amnibacterium kyonggiense]